MKPKAAVVLYPHSTAEDDKAFVVRPLLVYQLLKAVDCTRVMCSQPYCQVWFMSLAAFFLAWVIAPCANNSIWCCLETDAACVQASTLNMKYSLTPHLIPHERGGVRKSGLKWKRERGGVRKSGLKWKCERKGVGKSGLKWKCERKVVLNGNVIGEVSEKVVFNGNMKGGVSEKVVFRVRHGGGFYDMVCIAV